MGGGTKTQEDIPQNKASQIKLDATGGERETAHFGALLGFRPSTIQWWYVPGLQLANVLARRKMTFGLMERTRLVVQRDIRAF